MHRLQLGLILITVAAWGPALAFVPAGDAEATSVRGGQLVSLNASTVVLRDAAGKQVSFPLQPLTSLRRFGEPGAAAAEFQHGEEVRLTLRGGTVEEIRDAISEQLTRQEPFRVVSQDRDRYRFTIEPIDAATGMPQGERQTLGYGKPTFLVLRENPEFVFRVAAGARFWINRGAAASGQGMVAREVLDDASRDRFARQQRLRTLARLDVSGASARITTGGPNPMVQLGPDADAWAHRLRSADRIQVLGLTKAGIAQTIEIAGTSIGTPPALQLRGELSGRRVGDYVRLIPLREQVSYQRDIEPILQVNCLPCHGGRGASGFTIAQPERLRAGGPRGKGIVPGQSRMSLVYLTMTGEQNPRMPPDRDATPEQLALLQRWIDAGAVDDTQHR